MAITNLIIAIDSELKDKAQAFFEPLGMDMPTAVNVILRKLIFQEMPLDGFKKRVG